MKTAASCRTSSAPPPNVLGISSPQSIADTTIITESWSVLNGSAIDPAGSPMPSTSRAWLPTNSAMHSAWRTPRPTAPLTSIAYEQRRSRQLRQPALRHQPHQRRRRNHVSLHQRQRRRHRMAQANLHTTRYTWPRSPTSIPERDGPLLRHHQRQGLPTPTADRIDRRQRHRPQHLRSVMSIPPLPSSGE